MSKIIAIIITIALTAFVLIGTLLPPPKPELGTASYPQRTSKACASGPRDGQSGFTDTQLSERGIQYYVRTPKNYDATRAHPLLMVYSPGDRGGLGTERYTGLTTAATKAGYIIAYADNRPRTAPSSFRPISKEWIMELGRLPALIASHWCIDENQIILSGHSNGATASTALTILPESTVNASAIIISGAGWAKENFEKHSCPTPRPVMIMHSENDKTFPGYGPHSAKFWSGCNGCDDAPKRRADGCMVYSGCMAHTIYCQGTEHHTRWPKRNDAILKFLYTTSQ